MIAVNLSGVWRSAKAVTPHMIERQSGSIVMISSVNGLEAGPHFAHYTAAKHGVVGLMKTVALELAPYGIRCNSVHPGAVRSGMTENQMAFDMYKGGPGGTVDDLIEAGRHYRALKATTFMPPETIADATLFLNSDLASSITGAALPVEAGGYELAVVLEVTLPNLDHDTAQALADKAHEVCPYSNATRGNIDVQITVSDD
jgi:NAD(P)-dependent dehydrogenase (short-subunit alcohol dehydrogenase family)